MTDKVHIEICLGPECRNHGGPVLIAELQQQNIASERGHCRSLCHYAPIVHMDNHCIPEASFSVVISKINR